MANDWNLAPRRLDPAIKAARLDRQILNTPSLPKARQWLEWLAYHQVSLPADTGWKRGVRDLLIGLHHQIASSARRLRKNPTWDIQGTMTDDLESLEEKAIRQLRIFESLNPRDIPERFQPVMECLYGALRQQVRLGREIDVMRLRGHLDVEVMVDAVNKTAVEQ